ncbi:MAG: HD domain-containing protein [Pirellulaceae bacterium]
MDASQLVAATADYIRERMAHDASGHDWWHVHRVWQMARQLASGEPVDMLVVELAALLHDIADWKFHGGDETAGPRAARLWLASQSADEPIIDHVCTIIADLSFKGARVATPTRTLEGAIVQDADRLDAMGAIGIARAFTYGGFRGRPLYDPACPPQLHDSFAAYQKKSGPTINHFYEKLLLLRDRLNTPAARRMAAERHAYLEGFLRQFFAEWGTEPPQITGCE